MKYLNTFLELKLIYHRHCGIVLIIVVFANEKILNSLIDNDQILFKYCDENGNITNDSNPNGSLMNIAGICNQEKNVFGMMPHPERASDLELKNQGGEILFNSILDEII